MAVQLRRRFHRPDGDRDDRAPFAGFAQPWFVAPMGASAVLLFAVPASPLAQPWSIVGGNMVSATIGVSCAQLIAAPAWPQRWRWRFRSRR